MSPTESGFVQPKKRGRKPGQPNKVPGRRATDIAWLCNRCGKVKPVEEFPLAANKPCGRHNYCDPCMKAIDKIRSDRRRLGAFLLDELEQINSASFIESPEVQELLQKWREVNQFLAKEHA